MRKVLPERVSGTGVLELLSGKKFSCVLPDSNGRAKAQVVRDGTWSCRTWTGLPDGALRDSSALTLG